MRPFIIGIGEVLWDNLPSGPRMGGAPTNFACHAQALGADARIVSRVGDDDSGALLLRKLEEAGMSVSGISIDPAHATGSVGVEIVAGGQPVFTIHEDAAWDHLVADNATEDLFKQADAVCFGSLAQRNPASGEVIHSLVGLTAPSALRIFDVNLRQNYYTPRTILQSLELANVLKLNDAELPKLAEILDLTGGVREQFAALAAKFDLRLIAYTRGSEGSVLFDGNEWCEHPGLATDVCDTVGAGDSFTATVVMGILNGWSLDAVSAAANEVAAYVCSCDGAVPPMPERLRAMFHEQVFAAG
ncbi:carbohydrate kinase [Luteolibacter yonseiensis]|uniref:Carbohydrate kinase n=1 Tax=Luteolibacter yonseiensis TaxID=1144680 RepID=A0A934R6R4_9BACT|nr:carbohydrate kinase [Luteolibacter yonseiensis]MBK1816265.1 carbohydrate kinase [Luteolibacter yonseiensis]